MSGLIKDQRELMPVDKIDTMYIIFYSQSKRTFTKNPCTVILKNAELYIFERPGTPPRVQFPLDGCQSYAIPGDLFKLPPDTDKNSAFVICTKDGTDITFLPASGENREAIAKSWIQTCMLYSDNFKILIKHQLNTAAKNYKTSVSGDPDAKSAANNICMRLLLSLPKRCTDCMETAKAILSHIDRVEKVVPDEEDAVLDIYGIEVSPVQVLDAMELAGFAGKCTIVSMTNKLSSL